ncbi:hypothetical protein OH76DRAFT_1097269 [Lentinus brumalis]|uniref:C2H2-type domain-containing protein n=1 Tax=Lentinus brumalis TaxID=2498619 RepID=A0A371CVU3_9APHY|nr:hypothetical protein OH76DRAFT_1097269 [Polyporus brumalis]
MLTTLNNDRLYAYDSSMFPPESSPDNPAAIPSTSGALPDPWPFWVGDHPATTLDGAAALELSEDQFEAWLSKLCAVPTIPDISTPPPSATPATSRGTPSDCPHSTPPTSAVPFCVSPADTVFSVVPSLSSPSITASPDSLGHLSPTTPNLPSIPIPVKAVTLVTAPSSGLPPPTHLPTGFLALELLETRPNVAPGPPLYIPVYTMPCTASATSIVPPPAHTPAVSDTSPVDVALPPGSPRRPRRTRSRSIQSKSAGQTATKLFKCPIPECGVVIKNRACNYYQHMREQHDPTFQRANCPHCPCSYTRPSELNRHKFNKHPSSITEDIHAVTVNPPI